MNEEQLYLLPQPPLELSASVVRTGEESGHRFIMLDRCVLHPRGGGQREDHGRVNRAEITHVVAGPNGIQIYHDTSETFTVGQPVEVTVDRDWRHLQSRYHTGGHALAAAAEALVPGMSAFKAHHWEGEAYVMFRGAMPVDPAGFGTQLKDAIARDIAADLPVAVVGDPLRNRKIAIGTYSAVSCGGTHVTHLAHLGDVVIRSLKVKRGELKVGYDLLT